ncbi:uncharacterized protein PITG_08941 [Phytophthora infestans T30-4]|uniref:Uncharacterized protein n=1 Tax=Phytophthora infestans (strain T30-4) TaxID=403677 RepID=D0NDJ7_PHYIT|nr:uncharacterized protein PITG_08941 [Phytophthora infestans T30-4]EEY56154.1 hypothetical protein PITG_08941 [Phytophthora infestans T30-4]|eukprot:XP_002902984.1 hypothetical protein PITG_08941 [Phytophthora infestans T30-4]
MGPRMDFAAALSTKSAKALFLPIGNLAKSAKTALSFGIIRPDCPEDVIRIRTHLYGQLSTGLASESSSSPLWPMFEQSISHQSGGRLARHLLRLADRAELGGSVVMDVLLDGPYGSVFVDVLRWGCNEVLVRSYTYNKLVMPIFTTMSILGMNPTPTRGRTRVYHVPPAPQGHVSLYAS